MNTDSVREFGDKILTELRIVVEVKVVEDIWRKLLFISVPDMGFFHRRERVKTVKARVLDMKDIVARALIYSTLYHYMGLILNQ